MGSIQAVATDLQQDLRPFSRLLWQRGIPHRIHEHAGQQILSVADETMAEVVIELYRRYLAGEVTEQHRASVVRPATDAAPAWLHWVVAAPLTLLLVVGCVLGALVVFSGNEDWLGLLTFQAWFDLGGARFYKSIIESMQAGEFWRLWSPIFLHFGLLHLVFNSLWLWEFGRRIEYLQGHWRLLGLVIVIGLGSNCTQFYFANNVVFGGMSGVVYGLVGYCWGWSLRRPGQDFGIPRVLIYMLMGLMVVALTGIFSLFGFGAVANAAHFSGFVIGVAAGLLLASLNARGSDGLPEAH